MVVTILTFGVLLAPKNEHQAALGAGAAGCVVGVIGWLFLRCQGVPMADVGLGWRVWV